jgi:hypothetical protein
MTESGATPAVDHDGEEPAPAPETEAAPTTASAGVAQGETEGPTETETETETEGETEGETEAEPSWWQRSHPTFAGLVGFFSGVAYVIVIPGIYAALLGLLLSDSAAAELFPLIAIALLVPLGLLVPRKTRRFAQFMLLGVVLTAAVIGVTSALVIWILVKVQG